MNICIISGSARQNNNTIRVAKALEKMYASHHVQLIDFCSYDIPLVANGNLNADRLTAFQQGLYHAMNNAQLIYIITPEYNWSTTPEILNWLHRFGDKPFEQLFNNKVFALVGVSTGKGGKAPLLHLTGILHKIIEDAEFKICINMCFVYCVLFIFSFIKTKYI